jgi:type IV pilus assembly protein PilA
MLKQSQARYSRTLVETVRRVYHPSISSAGAKHMGYAQFRRQSSRGYFIRYATVVAVILFLTSGGAAQAKPAGQSQAPSALDLTKYPGLMPELGQLLEKLQHEIQVPPARGRSRLLPLLPESTVFYAALPNYGEASHQALAIFEREVQQNPTLHAWWQQGDMAADGPKAEDALEKVYQLSQYLGDEIVVSGAAEGGKPPSLVILAELRKPGLKDFVQRMTKEFGGNSEPAVRVLDVQELATARDTRPTQQLVILVRPDFVVAALDVAALRSFNARLDKKSTEFASTPFGQRVAQAYEGGASLVVAADLQKIVSQIPVGTEQNQKIFQRSGFADVKYLVWEHKTVDGQAGSQMELTFTSPRHGVASWLAAPGQLGSLDFLSPKAVMAGAILLKDPAQIFDDIEALATAQNPNALAALAQMQQGLKLSLKDDLFSHLSGEIAYEADNVPSTNPAWRIILKVADPNEDPKRLQSTVDTLLATMHMAAQQSEDGGVTYHTLQIPSAQKTTEISYAFVDGYWIIASSRERVTEAIRLHRSGESLARSRKLLESMPPGHPSEVSALLYEDAAAVAAMGLRQVSPALAESLSHASAEASPMVIAAYGEESSLREASRSGGVDAGVILVAAAIAIPNLLRARIAANESSAVANIRTVNTAQVMYSSSYPQRGFAHDLATLGPDPRGPTASSAEHASFIDATLGNAICTADAWCTKSGYQFRITAECKKQMCQEYVVVGYPVGNNTGTRTFCSISDGVVRYRVGAPLTSAVSVAECQMWSPLR